MVTTLSKDGSWPILVVADLFRRILRLPGETLGVCLGEIARLRTERIPRMDVRPIAGRYSNRAKRNKAISAT